MKSFHIDTDSLLGKTKRAFVHYENVGISFTEETDELTFFLLERILLNLV